MIEKEQPIESHMREVMNDIGRILGRAIKQADANYGFALLVFGMSADKGRMNYISNADRADMLAAMKEFIARNEGTYSEVNFGMKH